MTVTFTPNRRSRVAAAAGAIALQLVVGWVLITGLSGKLVKRLTEDIKVFDVAQPPVPKPLVVPVKVAIRRPAGAAAPPHARATPTQVVAPVPVIRLPPPPPLVIAAPVAATGAESSSGAATTGQGTGAGGQGDGRGAGSGGDGTGAGGTPARLIHGAITGRDYPPEARRAGVEGKLTTRYDIDAKGRITRCYVTAPSGSDLLDAATCRLVITRYRFAPARDGAGTPVEDTIFEDHGWRITPDAPGE